MSKAEQTENGLTTLFADNLSRQREASEKWVRECVGMAEEVGSFLRNRLQADLAAYTKLATAETLEDAMACQREFFTTAAAQYAEEASRISNRFVDITNDVLHLKA